MRSLQALLHPFLASCLLRGLIIGGESQRGLGEQESPRNPSFPLRKFGKMKISNFLHQKGGAFPKSVLWTSIFLSGQSLQFKIIVGVNFLAQPHRCVA